MTKLKVTMMFTTMGAIGFAMGALFGSPWVQASKSDRSPSSIVIAEKSIPVAIPESSAKALLAKTYHFNDTGDLYLNFCAVYPDYVVKRYFKNNNFMFEVSEKIALGPRVPEMVNNLWDAKEGDLSSGNYSWAYLRGQVKRNLPLDHIEGKEAKTLRKILGSICGS
ncbi:MAG: hypothetical protein H6624_03545 [Bdellovibrionaceae bacterium]|nr:hypothetical protein [Bdellovibrionales bacterium]MCB9083389.1 hypothetical protein [Pseudobdellovibrionaceae bacterium]